MSTSPSTNSPGGILLCRSIFFLTPIPLESGGVYYRTHKLVNTLSLCLCSRERDWIYERSNTILIDEELYPSNKKCRKLSLLKDGSYGVLRTPLSTTSSIRHHPHPFWTEPQKLLLIFHFLLRVLTKSCGTSVTPTPRSGRCDVS